MEQIKNTWVVNYDSLGGNLCGISINGIKLMPISISIEKNLNCLTILKLQIYICDSELKFVENVKKEKF